MMPIQDLLHRIRWDEEFRKGEFVIGYYDRMQQTIVRIPFKEIWVGEDNHFCFNFVDHKGETHVVPLHRIREVHRNGELIWHRATSSQGR